LEFPHNAEARFLRGMMEYHAAAFHQAEAFFAQVLALLPEHPQAGHMLAVRIFFINKVSC
jgi:hypothetical protein